MNQAQPRAAGISGRKRVQGGPLFGRDRVIINTNASEEVVGSAAESANYLRRRSTRIETD